MDNYIMINGMKLELTDEQVAQLSKNIEFQKKNPFSRANFGECYSFISMLGEVEYSNEDFTPTDDTRFKNANYCTDEQVIQQRAWHETLDRQLWRFSMMNDGDEIDWEDGSLKYCILFSQSRKEFTYDCIDTWKSNEVYFYDKHTAFRAVEEIVKPFMTEHPDFVW